MVRTYILGRCGPETESVVVAQATSTGELEEGENAALIVELYNALEIIIAALRKDGK
jgi:hypothetical protein